MLKIDPLDIAKFWMSVEIDKSTPLLRSSKKWFGHCWIWKGGYFQNGYGRYCLNRKSYKAHRVAFFLTYGDIPDDKCICHRCDNPRCVNPYHLWLGSSKENTQDMIIKGRLVRLRSKNPNTSSKYSGISFRKETGKWRTRIMKNYTNILVGEFDTEEEAHNARLKALKD